jgi:hypothetical protein
MQPFSTNGKAGMSILCPDWSGFGYLNHEFHEFHEFKELKALKLEIYRKTTFVRFEQFVVQFSTYAGDILLV